MLPVDIFSRQVRLSCRSKLEFHMWMSDKDFEESGATVACGSDYAGSYLISH
jgi:hypothetical protein